MDNQITEDFKNENVTVKLSRTPGCQVKFEISVSPKASEAAYHKAIKTVNKEVTLPGFRKGKAPESIVIENYGKHVDQEWKEILIQTSFQESLKLTNVYPLNEESVKRPELKNASREEESTIIIQFESTPTIPSVNSDDFSLQSIEGKEVNDEDVEKTIEQIRLHHASWEEVTDRPVQEGDFIDVDIDNVEDPDRQICKNSRFEVKEGKMGDWMINLVIGLNTGDTAEGMSEKGEEVKDEDFIPTLCRITVNGIHVPTMPEIDDELAKKVGLTTVKEMNERIKDDLIRQEKDRIQEKKREQIELMLLEKAPFDVPHSLIQSEKASYLQRYDLAALADKEDELKNLEERVDRDVDRALRMFFLARKITDDNQLSVSEQELMQEVMKEVYSKPRGDDGNFNADELRSRAYIRILSNKAKDFLISKIEK